MHYRRHLFGVPLLLVLVLGGTACGGLWHRIDRDALDRIPNDEKLALFDAENEVIIAKDSIEAAEREISDGREQVVRARAKVRQLDENPDVAGISSPDVLELYKEWAQLRFEMREDEMRHYYVRRKVAEEEVWLARARYEMAKAQLVHDHDPERGASVNVENFEEQAKDREGAHRRGHGRLRRESHDFGRDPQSLRQREPTLTRGERGRLWRPLGRLKPA